ncbi:aldo/keto reductase [Dysosmobacter welbionis]|uniref:aldo/keto reductase n=1 Tax=Dysosmobacter welbionis TaxID=2093857 RepID=UPI0032C0DF52
MKKRTLGKDLEVSAVSLGCMGLSHGNGAATEEKAAVRLLQEAADIGYTMFDTAETYGFPADPHHNEKLVGEALKGIRNKVLIATKFGVAFVYDGGENHSGLKLDSRPETIRKSVENSLKRLQTDRIDLYYQHRTDPKVSPEEVAEVMKGLMKEGKILHWGVSMASEEYIRRAHAVCPLTASQNVYSMLSHDESLFAALEELNIGLVACCPIAKGFTTGCYHKGEQFEAGDMRNGSPWFSDETMDRYQPLFDYMQILGKEMGATVGQLSLAWILGKKPWIVPIPGTRKSERLKENAGAADIVLTAEQMETVDKLLCAASAV